MTRTRSILLGGTATLVVAAVTACSGHKSAAPTTEPATTQNANPTSTVKPRPVEHPKPKRGKRRPKPANRAQPSKPAPRAGSHVPWHANGTSLVAQARGRRLAIYARPRAKRPLLLLRNPDGNGTPRVVLVHSRRPGWVRVYLPTRPNGRNGWVRERAVRVLRDPYRLVVHLRGHRLDLWKKQRLVLRAQTVVGASDTPTPLGMYYVVELLRPPDPHGSYGPYSFGISAHSNVLKQFAGGDGRVGIHGTNAPWLLGESVSHGCVRVRNDTIRRLARVLPLGTPVLIRR